MSKPLDAAVALARARRRFPSPEARRVLRERAGISQNDIAVALGVTRTAVCLWESGEREPRAENLQKYLALLDRLAQEALR
jgi:transcriptional regulator with XRE-family HTH domain